MGISSIKPSKSSMSVDLSNQFADVNDARKALAEVRALHDEMQKFVTDVFDRLAELADEYRSRPTTDREVSRRTEGEAVQNQVDQLTSVAAQLTELLAEQQRWMIERDQNPREVP